MMARHRNQEWNLPEKIERWEHANLAIFMDIRDELRDLNRLLSCHRVPRAMDALINMHKGGVKVRKPRKREATKG